LAVRHWSCDHKHQPRYRRVVGRGRQP
jgi:hypothetical protein